MPVVRVVRVLCAAMLLAVSTLHAQSTVPCQPDATSRRIGESLQALVDSLAHANPAAAGISLTVLAPKFCVAFNGTSGVADKSTGAALTPAHPHRIASNTKSYTAAAILRLVEDGKLKLEDPITRHLPAASLASLRRDGYAVDSMTITHLLTHTAGLYDYAMDPRFGAIVSSNPTYRWTRAEQVDSAVTWGAAYNAPGAAFHYTDTGYILLGEIIERLTGTGLAEAIRSLLHFKELGLSSTWLETLEPAPAGVPELAHQYLDGNDTRGFDASFDLYGGGGLAATTEDMARFTRALFVGGVFRDPGTIGRMTTLPVGITGSRAYALGLYQQRFGDDETWGHTGFWNTASFHVPARDVTVASSVTLQGDRVITPALLRGALQRVPH